MVMHAVAKITLFMCAGAIYVATGASKVSEMGGAGRRMPAVFACFALASLAVIGLPPMGGMWSKFLLVDASLGSGEWITAAAMIVSSLLSVAYLLPVAFRALFAPPAVKGPDFIRPGGTPAPVLVATGVTALACIALFVFADPIARFLDPIGTITLMEGAQ
jgi:multicomponent Na+:H+ antiporter subunit D